MPENYLERIATHSTNPLVKALVASGSGMGVEVEGDKVVMKGIYVDAYLLTIVLALRIAVGDIEIIDKSDMLNKKDYFDKLLKSCEKIEIKG